MSKNEIWLKKSTFVSPLIAFYFFVAFIEIIAEYNNDTFFIGYTKPLTIPILIGIYLVSAKSKNIQYLLALLLVWIANVFLLSNFFSFVDLGTIFFLFSQIIVINIVIRKIKYPGSTLLLVSSLPFICLYLIAANFAYNKLGYNFYLLLFQGIIMIFFSSLCLTNYFTKVTKSSSYLLASTILLTAAQLLIMINGIAMKSQFLESLTTVFFVIGEFLLYLFVLLEDKKQKRYKIVNKLSA
jgi:hypothetical protein